MLDFFSYIALIDCFINHSYYKIFSKLIATNHIQESITCESALRLLPIILEQVKLVRDTNNEISASISSQISALEKIKDLSVSFLSSNIHQAKNLPAFRVLAEKDTTALILLDIIDALVESKN